MPAIDIDAIRKRCEAAYPGPYKCDLDIHDPLARTIVACVTNDPIDFVCGIDTDHDAPTGPDDPKWKLAKEDRSFATGVFMAAAITDVPALLAALAAAEKALRDIIEGAPTEDPDPPRTGWDALGTYSDDPQDDIDTAYQKEHWRCAQIARAALSRATPGGAS
jgi:hypothetical protein